MYSGAVQRLLALLRIRIVEERLMAEYAKQEMRCPTYFSVGQEAVAVGVAAALGRADRSFAAHRNHAHYLAKGGSLKAMVAELYGKASGCAGGRGGSLHLVDLQAGFMGSTPIVGSTIPIAAGAAFADKAKRRGYVTAVFFGDGATEAGVFYETVNFAAVHKLPVVLVCENNLYSIYSSLKPRQPAGRSIANVATSLGVHAVVADGQDVEVVVDTAQQAVDAARGGAGPTLLEYQTYRYVQHVGPGNDDKLSYRPADELAQWIARDPLGIARERCLSEARVTIPQLEEAERAIAAEVAEAIAFAKTSEPPRPTGVLAPVDAGTVV